MIAFPDKERRLFGVSRVSMINLTLKLCLVAIVMGFAFGCATTSVFKAYPQQVNPVIQSVKEGKQVDCNATFTKKVRSQDRILYLMERGRVAQIQGQTEASTKDFKSAIDVINKNDQKAVVTASDGVAETAAVVVNDNAIPYEGYGYERVFVHHYQAWNYLASGDVEGAGVELRIAGAEQDSALKAHEKKVESAMREAEAQQIDVPLENPELCESFSAMDRAAGRVKNSFQNAYTFYVSGLVREIQKEENDAYIDYKSALEIFPENDYLQRDVVRLAIKLDMGDDLDRLKALFPQTYKAVSEGGERFSGCELVVFFEDAFVPQKKSIKIPLPIPCAKTIVAIAFPVYDSDKVANTTPLSVCDNQVPLGDTQPICCVGSLAVMALKEEIPVLVARQIIRVTTKALASKELNDQVQSLSFQSENDYANSLDTLWNYCAAGISSIYNVTTENADLRSWTTLPNAVQIMRTNIPSGTNHIEFVHNASGTKAAVDIEAKPGEKVIVRVIRTGERIYCSSMSF